MPSGCSAWVDFALRRNYTRSELITVFRTRGRMTDYPELHLLVAGEKLTAAGRRTHAVVNPTTEEVIGELPLADAADLDRALETAQKGFKIWRDSPVAQRVQVLTGAAR